MSVGGLVAEVNLAFGIEVLQGRSFLAYGGGILLKPQTATVIGYDTYVSRCDGELTAERLINAAGSA